jgi:hypothetical protein
MYELGHGKLRSQHIYLAHPGVSLMILSDPVRALLQHPVTVRMAVIDSRGFPHVVPIWFGMEGDDLMVISYRATRKNEFLKVNPKGAIQIGGDPSGTPGYLLKGEFTFEEDVEHRWLREITRHYETPELAEEHLAQWEKDDMVVLRFHIQKVTKI